MRRLCPERTRFPARENCANSCAAACDWHMIASASGKGHQGEGNALQNDKTAWTAPVIRWIAWDAHPQRTGAPASAELGFVDPMLRRRLSPLARISLKVAHDCAAGLESVRMVYAS